MDVKATHSWHESISIHKKSIGTRLLRRVVICDILCEYFNTFSPLGSTCARRCMMANASIASVQLLWSCGIGEGGIQGGFCQAA